MQRAVKMVNMKENLGMYYVEFDKFYLMKTLHPVMKGCSLNYNEVHASSIISMTKLKPYISR